MTITVILLLALALAILFAFACQAKTKEAFRTASEVKKVSETQDGKLANLRQELSGLREELARKNKALDEARDMAKKKLRKQAQKDDNDDARELSLDSASGEESERLKKTLQAVELQMRSMQEEIEKAKQAARTEAAQEFEQKANSYKEEIRRLDNQLRTHSNRAAKNKEGLQEAGFAIDLEALPANVVAELAKLYRKSQNTEKVWGLTQGKLQMAQERFAELQKRYFAVCRELAVVAGREHSIAEEEARDVAEDIIAKAEEEVQPAQEPTIEAEEHKGEANGVAH